MWMYVPIYVKALWGAVALVASVAGDQGLVIGFAFVGRDERNWVVQNEVENETASCLPYITFHPRFESLRFSRTIPTAANPSRKRRVAMTAFFITSK